jgi:heptosyltransferase-2
MQLFRLSLLRFTILSLIKMSEKEKQILVWLPSPMGDAILCTPALRAIRSKFTDSEITFLSNEVTEQILSPCRFNDRWIVRKDKNIFKTVKKLKQYRFTHSILLKNSFSCALACFLAGIPFRAGYNRDGRGLLLSEKLEPAKLHNGRYKPAPMIDYYLALAGRLGCESTDRQLELHIKDEDKKILLEKLPELKDNAKPVIILVPGGAFGPSKCWPDERFAQTADKLVDKYNARIVVSVSADSAERKIAEQICKLSKHNLINLGERPVNLGELKALFSLSKLAVTNDTGPRHIAIALKSKVITLFGPNDPAWTETGYRDEIKITGQADCAPCARPVCKKQRHICMESISVDTVFEAAERLLAKDG